MHEIRVTVPPDCSAEIAHIAIAAGIAHPSVYEVFVHGLKRPMHVVSAEAATPQAKAFIDSLLACPYSM